jgi:hypothetical protein
VFSLSFRARDAFRKAARLSLVVAFVLSGARSSGEESETWVVAAEKFEADAVPAVYESFPETVPRLLLARIGAIRERMVPSDEKQLRRLHELSSSRLKLVRDRADIVLERDRVVLSSDGFLVKARKKADAKKKIAQKEKEIEEYDRKIRELLDVREGEAPNKGEYLAERSPITLWKSGKELYVRPEAMTLGNALAKDGVSALLCGSVKDVAGYLLVTARLDTGVPGMPPEEITEAAAYDDIDELVATMTVRMIPALANKEPVRIDVSAEPENAEVYIDGKLVPRESRTVTVFSGEHVISVSAPGYATATKKARFEGADAFKVSIALLEEKTATIAFDTRGLQSSVYFNARYYGDTPTTVTLPLKPTIGEVQFGFARTWFVLDPTKGFREGASVAIRPNSAETSKRIEKTRNSFYWSLGALYLSLPFYMLSYGIAQDKTIAYNDGKLPSDSVDDVNKWIRISDVSRGVSIALGINAAFQLTRYILAANRVIPQFAGDDSKD